MSDKNVYKMTVVCCNYAVASYLWSVTTVMTMLYGHFGPKTLRHLYLVLPYLSTDAIIWDYSYVWGLWGQLRRIFIEHFPAAH